MFNCIFSGLNYFSGSNRKTVSPLTLSEVTAATTPQALRGKMIREELVQKAAATKIQALFRGNMIREELKVIELIRKEIEKPNLAATKIQQLFRDKMTFKNLAEKPTKQTKEPSFDDKGLAEIHWDAIKGLNNLIKDKINKGVDPNIRTKRKSNLAPAHYAVENGHFETLKLLHKNGVKITPSNRIDDGRTFMNLCKKEKYPEMFTYIENCFE